MDINDVVELITENTSMAFKKNTGDMLLIRIQKNYSNIESESERQLCQPEYKKQ